MTLPIISSESCTEFINAFHSVKLVERDAWCFPSHRFLQRYILDLLHILVLSVWSSCIDFADSKSVIQPFQQHSIIISAFRKICGRSWKRKLQHIFNVLVTLSHSFFRYKICRCSCRLITLEIHVAQWFKKEETSRISAILILHYNYLNISVSQS